MKVPLSTQRPVTAAATAATQAPASAATLGVVDPAGSSVFTRNRVLTFDITGEPASAPTKLDRAGHYLEALRDTLVRTDETAIGRIDPSASLETYFRTSFLAARALADAHPHEVKAFVDSVPVPADVRGLAEAAVGVAGLEPRPTSAMPSGLRPIPALLPGERHYWSWQHVPKEERTISVQRTAQVGNREAPKEITFTYDVEFRGDRLADWFVTEQGEETRGGVGFDFAYTLLSNQKGGIDYEGTSMIRNYGEVVARKVELISGGKQYDSVEELPKRLRTVKLALKTIPGGRDSLNDREVEFLGNGMAREWSSLPPKPISELPEAIRAAAQWYDQFLSDVIIRRPAEPAPTGPSLEVLAQRLASSDPITGPGALRAFTEHIATSPNPAKAIETGLSALLTHDLKYVMPLDEADRQLGGVAPKPYVPAADPRTAAERLNLAPAAASTLVALPAGLRTFAPRADAPAAVPLSTLPAEYHRLKHVLRTLKDQLELKLNGRTFDLVSEARAQALAIVDEQFGAQLAAAPEAERAAVFSYGRALLDDVDRWAEKMVEGLEN